MLFSRRVFILCLVSLVLGEKTATYESTRATNDEVKEDQLEWTIERQNGSPFVWANFSQDSLQSATALFSGFRIHLDGEIKSLLLTTNRSSNSGAIQDKELHIGYRNHIVSLPKNITTWERGFQINQYEVKFNPKLWNKSDLFADEFGYFLSAEGSYDIGIVHSVSITVTYEDDYTFIAWIVLPLGTIFIVLVVGLGYYLFTRQRRQRQDFNLESASGDFIPPKIDESTLTIPITHLRDYIEKARKPIAGGNSPTGFQLEYKHLERKSEEIQFDFSSASAPENAGKNRYQNVLAPEHTRVKLHRNKKPEMTKEGSATNLLEDSDNVQNVSEEIIQQSDYVNANFVRGLIPNSEKAYIASQGPMLNNLDDFWNLVWCTNVSVILMLTNEVENGRAKCDQYWPEVDAPLTLETFKLHMKELIDDKEGIIIRKLILELIESGETRTVIQIHNISWPDHGVPESTDTFLELSTLTDEANESKGPILVHCSAGIGRSGTFCLIHSTLNKIELDLNENPGEEPTINIVETTLQMRRDRGNMIQTVEQYEFGYHAIADGCERLVKRLIRANPDKDYAVAIHFKDI